MHMGYIFLGIISYNAIGMSGAILLMFAHGISIALLFGLCGHLRDNNSTLELDAMGGFGKLAPFLGLTFGIAGFASIGLPGFANFSSEVLVFFGAFKEYADGGAESLSNLQKATIAALWGLVLSAIYMLRGYRRIFMGPAAANASLEDISIQQRIPVLLLLAALLAIGFFPSLLLNLLNSNAIEFLSQR